MHKKIKPILIVIIFAIIICIFINCVPKNIESKEITNTENSNIEQYADYLVQNEIKKIIIIEDGKEKIVEPTELKDKESIIKIDLDKNKIDNTIIKFLYEIKITNIGQASGYVTKIYDYIPNGFKFVEDDNVNWKQNGKIIESEELKDTIINPEETEKVFITLTWINKSDNLGLKNNVVKIEKCKDSQYNEVSIINENANMEPVIITIKTGKNQEYILLIASVIIILMLGILYIKKNI